MRKRPKCYQGYGHVFARKIGKQLRIIRIKQGKTLEQVEFDNNIQGGQLDRMEYGIMASWRVYEKLLDYYGYELKLEPLE